MPVKYKNSSQIFFDNIRTLLKQNVYVERHIFSDERLTLMSVISSFNAVISFLYSHLPNSTASATNF